MAPLEFKETHINGVMEVRRVFRSDERGSFETIFDLDAFSTAFTKVAQVNLTRTRRVGSIRGLHIQLPPTPDAKLVSCIRGTIFDVAVDLRGGSQTFGSWVGRILRASEGNALLVPTGCAHGLQTLDDDCEVVYVHSGPYDPDLETGLHPLDPDIGVDWPLLPIALSERDKNESRTLDSFSGLSI